MRGPLQMAASTTPWATACWAMRSVSRAGGAKGQVVIAQEYHRGVILHLHVLKQQVQFHLQVEPFGVQRFHSSGCHDDVVSGIFQCRPDRGVDQVDEAVAEDQQHRAGGWFWRWRWWY